MPKKTKLISKNKDSKAKTSKSQQEINRSRIISCTFIKSIQFTQQFKKTVVILIRNKQGYMLFCSRTAPINFLYNYLAVSQFRRFCSSFDWCTSRKQSIDNYFETIDKPQIKLNRNISSVLLPTDQTKNNNKNNRKSKQKKDYRELVVSKGEIPESEMETILSTFYTKRKRSSFDKNFFEENFHKIWSRKREDSLFFSQFPKNEFLEPPILDDYNLGL